MRICYDKYQFSIRERIQYGLFACGLWAAVNFLCYRALWLIPFYPLFLWGVFHEKKKKLILKRKQRLYTQFKDAMSSLGSALRAGFSLENAILETYQDLKRLYGKEMEIVREFHFMILQMKNQIPVEKLMEEWGERSGIEDIINFSEVLTAAKRTGGNLNRILERTTGNLQEQIEAQKAIDASVAAKAMEHKIMSAVPAGIILYMQAASPGFLEVLYGNLTGAAVMTLCLIIYTGAYLMGRRIAAIEV